MATIGLMRSSSIETPTTTIRDWRGSFANDLLQYAGHSDALEDGRRAQPPQPEPGVEAGALRGIHHHVGAHALGQRAPHGGEVGGHDGLDIREAKPRDDGEPDGTAAHHDGRVAGLDVGARDSVNAHRHGLGQRGVLGRQAVRHGNQHRLHQEHALGESSGHVVRIADAVKLGAPNQERGVDDARALRMLATRAGPMVEDLRAELVPHDDVPRKVHHRGRAGFARSLDHLLTVLERVEIGSADAAGQRPHQDFAGLGFGLGHRVHDDLGVAHDCCSHLGPLLRLPPSYRAITCRSLGLVPPL